MNTIKCFTRWPFKVRKVNFNVIAFLLMTILYCSLASAQMPLNNPIPGGVAVIPLYVLNNDPTAPQPTEGDTDESENDAQISKSATHKAQLNSKPIVKFGDRAVLVITEKKRHYAVVGLPADIAPGRYILTIKYEHGETQTATLKVLPAVSTQTYQTFTLPQSLIDYDFSTHQLEEKFTNYELFSTYEIIPTFNFNLNTEYQHIIPYGLLLVNEESSELVQHSQLTLLTDVNEIAITPAAGKVEKIMTIDANPLRGEDEVFVVYINHGSGLLSILSHLSESVVNEGDLLQAGETVGLVSSILDNQFGRLSWGLLLNGYYIDPLQFSSSSSP